MGRTSAKSIRADKMMEVIFNGSKTKKPSEFAKVSLFFDNSAKDMPVEEEQVLISRKVNKKGISIYKLNGKTVTRETILEILRKTHVQPDGHNIVLQGDVTEIVESSPKQRRETIDEISGIREFDQKREKARKELETVEKRLNNSAIVLDERKTNLDRLKIEKEDAEKHVKFTKEVEKLKGSLAKRRLETAEKGMEVLREKINEKSTEWKKAEEDFKEADRKLTELEKEKKKVDEKILSLSSDISVIKETENLKREISEKHNKIESKEFEIKHTEEMIKRFEEMQSLQDTTSKAVKAIMRLKKKGVYGTISQLSKVKSEYQTAIEIAAGGHIDDIIVDSKDTAVECVKYLKENKIGRATFLPLDKIKERELRDKKILKEKGIVDVAINLVDFDKKYWHAFSFVFGSTVIAEKIDLAKKYIGKARFVTLDGDLLEKSGAIIGGFFRKTKGKFIDSSEIDKYRKRKEDAENEISSLQKGLEKLKDKLKSISMKEVKEDVSQVQKEVEETNKKIEETRKQRSELYGKKEYLQEEVNRLNINKAKLEAELENVKEEFKEYKIKEEYKLDINKLEIKLIEAMKELNSIGAVNMKALEDYNKIKVTYTELKDKVEKLAEEREKVFEMMMKVETQRREVFFNTFNELKQNFKTVFSDLTGGESNIILENDDIEGGLIIEASPGKKKLLNIDAMSGGEKTLTAMAFLFAIQMFSPAPFYILDEVDAALDKPNTKKIVELIKKYSENAQFIVISHNDVTMQAADSVYGVSMSEGESHIVAIRMPS